MKIQCIGLNYYFKSKNSKHLNFKGFECSEDNFELKKLQDLPCPICSIPMIQKQGIEEFCASVKNKTGRQLIDVLEKYDKYYHETEKEVVDIIINEAMLHPNYDMAHLAQEYLNNELPIIQKQQITEIEKIKKTVINLIPKSRFEIIEYLNSCIETIKNDAGGDFSKQEFISELDKLTQNFINVRKKILKTASKLPDSNQGAILFFKKYLPKSKKEFVSQLLLPSLATCEHIRPKSQNGANNTANYLVQCREDNSKRGQKPFMSQMTGAASLFNIKRYFDEIARRLASGEISKKYRDYLEDISKTICEETNGEIDVSVPKVQASLNRDELITKVKKGIDAQNSELSSIERLRAKFKDDEEYKNICKLTLLKKRQKILENILSKQKKKLSELQKIIAKYNKKEKEIRLAEEQLNQLRLGSNQYKKLKNSINTNKKFISRTDIEELTLAYEAKRSEYKKIYDELITLNEEIANLGTKITFAQQYKKEIENLRLKLSMLDKQKEELTKFEAIKKEIEKIRALIARKNAEIEYCKIKSHELDAKQNVNDVVIWRQMLEFSAKTANVQNNYFGFVPLAIQNADDGNYFGEIASILKSKISEIEKKSPAVKKVIIETKEDKLKEELKNIVKQEKELMKEYCKYARLPEREEILSKSRELEREIASKQKLLTLAKERQKCADLENRYIHLQESLVQKKDMLDFMQNPDTTDEILENYFNLNS